MTKYERSLVEAGERAVDHRGMRARSAPTALDVKALASAWIDTSSGMLSIPAGVLQPQASGAGIPLGVTWGSLDTEKGPMIGDEDSMTAVLNRLRRAQGQLAPTN